MLKHDLLAIGGDDYGVPCRLRGLLYRAFDLLADPQDARG